MNKRLNYELKYYSCVLKNEGEVLFVILVIFWLIHLFFGISLKSLILTANIFYMVLVFFHLIGVANYWHSPIIEYDKSFLSCEVKYNRFSVIPYLIVIAIVFVITICLV